MNGHFRPLRTVVQHELDELVAMNVLKKGLNHLGLEFWIDGSGLARTASVLGCVRFSDALECVNHDLPPDQLSRALAILKRVHSWLLLPSKETYAALSPAFSTIVGEQFAALAKAPFTISGGTVHVSVRLLLADNKATHTCMGLNKAYPCPLCYCSRKNFSSYTIGHYSSKRDLESIWRRKRTNDELVAQATAFEEAGCPGGAVLITKFLIRTRSRLQTHSPGSLSLRRLPSTSAERYFNINWFGYLAFG